MSSLSERDPDPLAAGGDLPSPEELGRNVPLLSGYDYAKYPSSITGFTGVNRQRIVVRQLNPAVRTRIGERGNFKGAICRLSDGTLIAAVSRRIDDKGLFGIHCYVSGDRGDSWSPLDNTELLGKEMSLTALPDDSLLLTVETHAPGYPNRTFSSHPAVLHVHGSQDRGRTWSTRFIEGPEKPRRVLVEPDGSLFFVRAHGSAYLQSLHDAVGKPFQPSPDLELLRSRDGGHTWTASRGRVAWNNCRFGETAVVRLRNGRLLAALRSHPPDKPVDGEGTQVTYLTESQDGGGTWCAPWPMGNTAEVQVYLLLLSDGRLLATYTNYHLPFGVSAVVSSDNGRTWSYDRPIELAVSADCYTGWPVTVDLGDGELITCYMITAHLNDPPHPTGVQRSVCETVRWRLPL